MRKLLFFVLSVFCSANLWCQGKQNSLAELQQSFVNMKFGMFIHFNMGTFLDNDWADPDAPLSLFNPTKLDCGQWARTAKSAKMRYGCLTTKHHNGFCLWDTKTTDYNAVNSPLGRDVVREYVDAFRKEGLKVMLYFSILDMHHQIRPGLITREDVRMIKEQLTELFSNYGDITAIIIDGWDAPWSRISYEDVPFNEIYSLIKSLQPDCLVMDLNAAKYPADMLFYTDIKSYEQNAGQHISKETNTLPALSCLPINSSWFWKTSFPHFPVKDARMILEENVNPMNSIGCNFILNVAPNREGLIDPNVVEELKKVGQEWDDQAVQVPVLKDFDAPMIYTNIAKHCPSYSSWSDDMWIMDFANDDDFKTAWRSNPSVQNPWYIVDFGKEVPFNAIIISDLDRTFSDYTLYYERNGEWLPISATPSDKAIKVHRFGRIRGDKVKVEIKAASGAPSIMEFGVYDEER